LVSPVVAREAGNPSDLGGKLLDNLNPMGRVYYSFRRCYLHLVPARKK